MVLSSFQAFNIKQARRKRVSELCSSKANMSIVLLTGGKPKPSSCYAWQRTLIFEKISKLCTSCIFKNIKMKTYVTIYSTQPEGLRRERP